MTARCPSDLALEKLLLAPESTPHAAHVDGCAACQARLVEMRRQGEQFLQFVYPATVEAVEAAAEKPPLLDLRRWLAPLPALATAAAILLLARPFEAPEGGLQAKGGGALGLAVFVQDGGAAHAVRDGEPVRPDAEVRFRVSARQSCRLWILSLDAQGEVSRLYPAEGTGGAAISGTAVIPGGAVLDGKAGPERIYAVCTPQPSTWKALAAQIKSSTGPGEVGVRAERRARGLPAGTLQDSLLLEKRS